MRRGAKPRRMDLTEHARKNRASWDASSDAYQAEHGAQLGRAPLAWGIWSIPESGLNVLGDVAGKRVLEFGCGAAQWSIALASRGARCTGLDNSQRQLEHARAAAARAGVDVALVHGSAEATPFADASFDVVFCDHGAMSFADPRRTVPEAARLLRTGGLFAFSAATPLLFVCWDEGADRLDTALHAGYFGLHASDDGETVAFTLPQGEWIRLFRRSGLVVEDLIELRPPEGATTTYSLAPYEWARKWPAEQIWRLRKA